MECLSERKHNIRTFPSATRPKMKTLSFRKSIHIIGTVKCIDI